jgi:hypothetical protein
MVNLTVFDHNGCPHSRTSITLIQEGDDPNLIGGRAWCEWMPYQKGQAAKTEAAEARGTVITHKLDYEGLEAMVDRLVAKHGRADG